MQTIQLSPNTNTLQDINKSFEGLNVVLQEKHFKGINDVQSFKTINKIVNSFGEPLLKLYLGLNLNFEKEITPLWEEYYTEVFETKLKVCKNPMINTSDFEYDNLAVKDVILSAVSYFNDLGDRSKNGKDTKKEQTQLFSNIFNYHISYKKRNGELKPYVKQATKWLLRFLNGKLRVSTASSISQPDQGDLPYVFSQSFQDTLDSSCNEAYDLISQNSQENIADQDKAKVFHYSLAELLLFFANAQAREMPSGKILRDVLINDPIQKKLTSGNIKDCDPTFSELAKYLDESKKPLVSYFEVALLNLEKDCIQTLSSKNTPSSIVSDAVFASLSLLDYFQKVVIRTKEFAEEILLIGEQSQPYKFLALVESINYILPNGKNVVLGIEKNNIHPKDFFAIKYKGEPQNALDFNKRMKAQHLAVMSVSSGKVTDQTRIFYARWSDATQNYKIVGPTQKALNKKKWMENIMDSIGDKTLSQIMIPGSHDAGTNKLVCFVANEWAKCQTTGFKKQLDAGIRYFDLRLAYYPKNKKEHWWFRHGDWNARVTLKDLLDAVSSFLKENEKEIVILDFTHFRDPCDLKEFEQRLEFLRPYITENYIGQKIKDLVANNKRLVLLSDQERIDKMSSLPWGRTLNTWDGWPNKNDINTLKEYLEPRVQPLKNYRDKAGDELTLTQGILTPTFSKIMPSVIKKVNKEFPEILMQQSWLEKVNVIFSDYVGTNVFVDVCIHANTIVRAEK